MTLFLLNILFAVLWCLVWGAFDFYMLLSGFAFGYVVLGVYSRVTAVEGYGRKVWQLLRFTGYFVRLLIVANVQIAVEILTPRFRQTPRIVRLDTKGMTPIQRTVLANIITLTPGSLVIDCSPNREIMYVHCMYAADRESAVKQLETLKNRLMSEVF